MNKRTPAGLIAFGGMMAALAIVIMSLGGLIPIATYTSPMICIIICQLVSGSCGRRIGWSWYAAVSILALLLSPDKEAAAVFLFIGYYPMIKPVFDRSKLKQVWKLVYFNTSITIMYWLLINLFGLSDLKEELFGDGLWMLLALAFLGNMVFFLMDRLLDRKRFGGKNA